MKIRPYYLIDPGRQPRSLYISIHSRVFKNGFERCTLSIALTGLTAMAEEERLRPGSLHRILAELYPDEPRPASMDIMSTSITPHPKTPNMALVGLIIKRGHYFPNSPITSRPTYKLEEITPTHDVAV